MTLMECEYCKNAFPEKEIQSSHDVPCYLFYEVYTRKEKKNLADKYPRHWLCKRCHGLYEASLNILLKRTALDFSDKFFGGKNGN